MFFSDAKQYFSERKGIAGIIAFISVVFVTFHLYTGFFGSVEPFIQRGFHLLMGLLLVFFMGLGKAKTTSGKIVNCVGVLGVIASIGYIFARFDYVTVERFPMVTPLTNLEKFLGILLIVLIIESVRRIVGTSLVIITVAFVVYPFLGPYLPGIFRTSTIPWTDILDQLYLTTEGIFGVTIGISSTMIALFIIFGAFISTCGAGNLLFDLSAAAVGKSKGGPAKIAVLASGLMGSINGAPTANVATIGALTIPMMKKLGYNADFAGGVEACASTGGQFMPPVMGAIAFVMVAFTGIPYSEICILAVVPAMLFYLSIYSTVHLEALRLNLPAMESTKKVSVVMKEYGHMLLPIALLVYLLVTGYSPAMAGATSTVFIVVVAFFRSTTRPTFGQIMRAFETAAKGALVVIMSTAMAGIIIGIIDFTGIGDRLATGLVAYGGDHLFPVLGLIAVVAIILGMGMPPVPAYVMQVGLTIPAVIDMGLPVYVAHLFVFYFSGLAVITPPVAVAAYAAAGLADSSPMKTGWQAFRIAIPSFIIPFVFVLSPALLLQGSLIDIILVVTTAIFGVICMSTCMEGFLLRNMNIVERVLAFVAGILLILPFNSTILPGFAILAGLYLLQYRDIKKKKVNPLTM